MEGALSSIKFLSQQKITHRVPKSEKPYMSIKTFDKICSVFGGTLIEGKNLRTFSKNETPTLRSPHTSCCPHLIPFKLSSNFWSHFFFFFLSFFFSLFHSSGKSAQSLLRLEALYIDDHMLLCT